MLKNPLLVAVLCSSEAILLGQTVRSGVLSAQVPAGATSSVVVSAGGPMDGVMGAPFSGVRESETSQTLADGTHITRKLMTEKIWRDGEGRMRREHSVILGPNSQSSTHTIIWISDPVAGYRYTLDPQNRIAHRFALSQATISPSQLPAQVQTNQSATSKTGVGAGGGGTSSTGSALSTPARKSNRESLGTKSIDGLLVEGTRFTTVIPEGAVGNDRPIATVSESWFSPELKEMIESTHSDPRYGETVQRLTNIDRNNPDPSLFEVPPGYEMVDDPQPNVIRFQKH